ncbi:MAG TPA: type II secretion system secretin GspD [Kofleriaceae bacterium]|nr:type II secretion system secretin GspD [Kofleriaceae bacterium]
MSRTDAPLITVPKARGDTGSPGTVAGANGTAADAPAAPTGPARPEPYLRPGSGRMINESAARAPAPDYSGAGEATFNFEGESLHAVVKAILGDLLQQNYVIAPGVQGTVTLATPRPVDAAQALSLLEMVLAWNNARLIWADGRYNVVPADQALMGAVPRVGSPANARGYEVRAVPLRYIAANEMSEILKPYARPNAIVQIDKQRNLIVLAGTRAELQNYLRTVEIFDVDWLAGMSVGVYPLQSAEAVKVVTDLEKVFGEGAKTPVAGMFRFMPLEGQNAVMVITPQASYLRQVEDWIARMDAGGEGARLYVYEVKYVKATDLADQLGEVYGNAPSSSGSGSNNGDVMPGLEPVEVRTDQMPPAGGPIAPATPPPAGPSGGDTLSIAGGEVGISAVEESNSLLVRASPAQWESIRRAIDRLDTMPVQVHIEAQVVEVKLTGELSYGVSWFFGNQVGASAPAGDRAHLHALAEHYHSIHNLGSIITDAGSAFTFLGPSAEAIISTLDSVSDLRVLSAPSVLVRNNVEANFNSGQQIPVASTIINNGSNTNTDNAYSQVQFRQTGISLTVKPRVSADGMVFMDITQDVSSPSASGPVVAGNVSVDNNKLHTEVAVQDGETVMLAGLIKTENAKGSNGFPGLSRLPVIGALFGNQTRNSNRNEVLVLITPRVVRDPNEARALTDEYGQRFRALEPLRKGKVTH